jgi:hypothetical protein
MYSRLLKSIRKRACPCQVTVLSRKDCSTFFIYPWFGATGASGVRSGSSCLRTSEHPVPRLFQNRLPSVPSGSSHGQTDDLVQLCLGERVGSCRFHFHSQNAVLSTRGNHLCPPSPTLQDHAIRRPFWVRVSIHGTRGKKGCRSSTSAFEKVCKKRERCWPMALL